MRTSLSHFVHQFCKILASIPNKKAFLKTDIQRQMIGSELGTNARSITITKEQFCKTKGEFLPDQDRCSCERYPRRSLHLSGHQLCPLETLPLRSRSDLVGNQIFGKLRVLPRPLGDDRLSLFLQITTTPGRPCKYRKSHSENSACKTHQTMSSNSKLELPPPIQNRNARNEEEQKRDDKKNQNQKEKDLLLLQIIVLQSVSAKIGTFFHTAAKAN